MAGWFSFFKAEGRRLAFVGWELGFPGGVAAVCERVRFFWQGKMAGYGK